MGFWEDASPVVKGAIVVGALGMIYLAIAALAGLPPYGGGTDEAITPTRGTAGAE
jgi:hypothetical protein